MAHEMWGLKVIALVVGLLVLVLEARADPTPSLAIILPNSASDTKLFLNSPYYEADKSVPTKLIAGRTIYFGKFAGREVACVNAGKPLANVGATVQMLLDRYRTVSGVLVFGKSGGTTEKYDVPNVVVATHVAYTGVWNWQEMGASQGNVTLPSLKIGDYNVPRQGENKLGSIQFQDVRKYTPKGSKKNTFWFYVDPTWLSIANEIKTSDLDRCIGTTCSDDLPEIVQGQRIATSDIIVSNKAFADFLYSMGVVAVDTASAPIASVAVANGKPFAIFRGISNRPGTPYNAKLSALAGQNVLKLLKAFVERLPKEPEEPHLSMYVE